ncbi:hypothetical protein LguiA_007336 [Lonicera macranthoides]
MICLFSFYHQISHKLQREELDPSNHQASSTSPSKASGIFVGNTSSSASPSPRSHRRNTSHIISNFLSLCVSHQRSRESKRRERHFYKKKI